MQNMIVIQILWPQEFQCKPQGKGMFWHKDWEREKAELEREN